ncbi:MAG: PLP-dependent aspartate aminotransferase family protein [Caldilineaceae bacterium]
MLCVNTVYGPVRGMFGSIFSKFGVEVTYFHSEQSTDLSPLLRDNTKLIFLESPSTGLFEIQDLRAVAKLARANNIWTAIDNTWATPLYQKPLDLGLDISIHSGTKYIAGHSDMMLGLVAGTEEAMKHVHRVHGQLGASLAPDDAYLAIRGLRTLPLRLKRHEASALEIAEWLEGHPMVSEVNHPGLPSFEGHQLHRSQSSGDSGLFSFALKQRSEAARAAFVNSLAFFSLGYSWGGYESLLAPRLQLLRQRRTARQPRPHRSYVLRLHRPRRSGGFHRGFGESLGSVREDRLKFIEIKRWAIGDFRSCRRSEIPQSPNRLIPNLFPATHHTSGDTNHKVNPTSASRHRRRHVVGAV